jgi:CheY-like chemotaxis protein
MTANGDLNSMAAQSVIDDSLRILLVEDVASDAEVELRELRRSGLTFDARTVETEADFRRELSSFKPDIILSDFSLPRFSGMSALTIARELPKKKF